MEKDGFPRDSIEECIEYWQNNAYYEPIVVNDFLIWVEMIGDILMPHFAVLDEPKTTLATFKELRGVLLEWFNESNAKIMMAIVDKNSAGEKVCRMLKFQTVYELDNNIALILKKKNN